ncbi:MAG: hypothetical protein ACTSWN_15510 [Promethearchaeota archaeon]
MVFDFNIKDTIRLVIESTLKFYSPQVVANLSKEGYDKYLSIKQLCDEIDKDLSMNTFNVDDFRNKYLKLLNDLYHEEKEWKMKNKDDRTNEAYDQKEKIEAQINLLKKVLDLD